MPRKSSDYEIVIPVSIRDNTKTGAKSVNSSVDKMAQQTRRDIEKQMSAAESLQKQRSSALISQWNKDEAAKTRALQNAMREREKLERNNAKAVESLQKQRSAALISQWRKEQADHAKAENAKAKAAQQAHREIEKSNAIMTQRYAAAWGAVKTSVLAVFAAIVGGAVGALAAINRAATFQRLEQGLTALMGSAEGAKKEIEELKVVARVPGLGFREAIQGSIALQAVGYNAEEARKALLAFGNAVAFTGGKAELDRIIVQLSQMAAAEKVTMQDLRPIIQTAPLAARALKEAFGTISPEELNKKFKTSREFILAWIDALNKGVKAPDSVANAIENLDDAWDRFLISIGKPFLPIIQQAMGPFSKGLEALGVKVQETLNMVIGDLGKVWRYLPESTKKAFQDMLNSVKGLGGIMVKWFKDNYALILSTVELVLIKIGQFWDTYGARIKAIASSHLETLGQVFTLALHIIRGDWEGTFTSFSKAINANFDRISNSVALLIEIVTKGLIAATPQIIKIGVALGMGLVQGMLKAITESAPMIVVALADSFGPQAIARAMIEWGKRQYQGEQLEWKPFQPTVRKYTGFPEVVPEEKPGGAATERPQTEAERKKAERAARDAEIVSSMKESMAELADAFREEFGKAMPMRFGQTAFHQKLGYRHDAAADISLDARTREGMFVMDWLESHGINARASLGPEVSKRTGKVISTGVHIHAGELSGPLGRALKGREALLSPKALKEAQEEFALGPSPYAGMTSQQVAAALKAQREGQALAEPEIGDLAELPTESLRQWETYYEEMFQNEEELNFRRRNFAAEYLANERNMATELGNIEEDLKHMRAQASDDQFSTQRRLLEAKAEERDLTRAIIDLQDEMANSPVNQSLRIQLALLEDLNDIRRRDEEAIKDYNRAMLEMGDATTYHSQQADTAVARFLASQRSVTDIVVDAKIGVMESTFDLMDKGLSKITDKLGIMKSLVHDILSGFIRLALSRFFQAVFLGQGQSPFGGGGAAQGGGGGLTSMLGNIFGGILGGKGAMNTGGFAGGPGAGGLGLAMPGGSPLGGILGLLTGGGITAPPSASAGTGSWGQMAQAMGMTAGKGGMLSNLGKSLGPMLPFLGLSTGLGLGIGLGGQSRFGQILGGVGGMALGGALGAAAFTALGGTMSAGLAGFMAIAGPAALIAGPLLLAGAFILSRNARRRAEETKRDQATKDTGSALWAILRAVQTDKMDGPTARSEIERLHQEWIAFGNTLKDSKTRRHHMDTWNHFAPIIGYIEDAIKGQAERANIRARMSPVFAGGGYSHVSQMVKVRPGEGIKYPGSDVVFPVRGMDKGYDTEYMHVPRGTRIMNQSEMRGSTPMAMGGVVGSNPVTGDLPELHIDSLELIIDENGLASIVIKSPLFKKAVIHDVKLARKERKLA